MKIVKHIKFEVVWDNFEAKSFQRQSFTKYLRRTHIAQYEKSSCFSGNFR